VRSCEEYQVWISALLDGELSEDEQMELREHMAACQDCQQYFDDLSVIHAALTDGDEVPVPEGFADRVMEQVRAAKQAGAAKAIRFPYWKRWAAMAACCAVVLLGVWSFQSWNGGKLAENQSWVTTADAPQMARNADVPAALDDSVDEKGIMPMTDDGPVVNSQARMTEDKASVENEMEDTAPEFAAAKPYCQEAAEDVSVSPASPARDASGETLTTSEDAVRLWVEEHLNVDWVSGQTYDLTEDQYYELLEWLTETGAEFQVEPGDGYRLAAE